jgi:hypothetical protein
MIEPPAAGVQPAISSPHPTGVRLKFRRLLEPLTKFLERHEKMLWWAHSGYALLLGMVVMWLGSKNLPLCG